MRTLMAEPSYEIVPVQEEDHDRIVAFLRRTFFADEPLNIAIGLLDGQPPCPEDGRPGCPALEAHCREALLQGVSLAAVESASGNIVGVTLNAEAVPEGSDQLVTEAALCTDAKFRQVLKLMAHVDRESNVFQRYGVEKILEMRILAVDGEWRGKGIATALIKRTLEQARDLRYPLFRVDCTSAFSAKAMEKVGLERIFTMKYEDYLDEDEDGKGEDIIDAPLKGHSRRKQPVFKPAPPHSAVVAYVKEIRLA